MNHSDFDDETIARLYKTLRQGTSVRRTAAILGVSADLIGKFLHTTSKGKQVRAKLEADEERKRREALAEYLNLRSQQTNIPQYSLAAKVGEDRQRFNPYFQGLVTPGEEVLRKILHGLHSPYKNLDEVVEGAEKGHKRPTQISYLESHGKDAEVLIEKGNVHTYLAIMLKDLKDDGQKASYPWLAKKLQSEYGDKIGGTTLRKYATGESRLKPEKADLLGKIISILEHYHSFVPGKSYFPTSERFLQERRQSA